MRETLLSDKLRAKAIGTLLECGPDELMNHPNLYFFEQKRLDGSYKDVSAVQVAVQVNVQDRLTPEQREAIAATLYEPD
jgi:hypothetical protein